ncbi:hypothetical protein AB0I82_04205 [Streptomyces sp. NPDC050315]|uniref:hypothetical protein n=1 Tax=Streptomyces sp. NPDC050315 TaxID=3155039 RepID=UPI00341AC830
MTTPILLSTVLLLSFLPTAGPFALAEVRACTRPGTGRHRRVTRGRHAARGGRR